MDSHQNNIVTTLWRMRHQLRQDYLFYLYSGLAVPYTRLDDVNTIYQFEFPDGSYFAFMLWATPKIEWDSIDPKWIEAAQAQVSSAFQNIDGDFEAIIVGCRLFCVCGIQKMDQDAMYEKLKGILTGLENTPSLFSCRWTLGLGKYVRDLSKLSESVMTAQHAIKYSVVFGPGLYDGNEPSVIYEGGLTLLDGPWQLALERGIQKLQIEELKEQITDLFAKKEPQFRKYPAYASMLALQIIRLSVQKLREWMPIDRETYETSERYCAEIDDQPTIEALTAHVIRGVLALCERYRLFLCHGGSSPVWLACTYIKEHYTEKISLEDLARCTNRNPQYLSSIFAKEQGMSVTEYITDLRMERAKCLLRETDEQIARIGNMVGYQDAKYFSRVFKKQTGIYPRAYREQSRPSAEQPER